LRGLAKQPLASGWPRIADQH